MYRGQRSYRNRRKATAITALAEESIKVKDKAFSVLTILESAGEILDTWHGGLF